MSTITEPHQTSAVGPLAQPPSHTATSLAVSTVCQLCAATGAELLVDLGRAPLSATAACVVADAVGGGACRRLRLVRCLGCGTIQPADELDGDARHHIATAVGDRSFAGRPDLARRFCEDTIDRWGLRGEGHVVEIGSGTGSLLRFFRAWQLPVLGLELDDQLSRYARLRRIPTWRAGFDAAVARRICGARMRADLLIVSTPIGAFDNLRTLMRDAASVLRDGGVMTLEIPDILRIVGRTRCDEIGHAYPVMPSVGQLERLLLTVGLELVDIERAEVAPARLRLWIQRPGDDAVADRSPAVGLAAARVRTRRRAEAAAEIDTPTAAAVFGHRAQLVREQIIKLLDDARAQHCAVVGGGAGTSAVALAVLAGLRREDVTYTVDPDPGRCATLLPGTDIPVVSADQASAWRPDLVLALEDVERPPAWDGVPVYSVTDLIDVIHRLTVRGAECVTAPRTVTAVSATGTPRP